MYIFSPQPPFLSPSVSIWLGGEALAHMNKEGLSVICKLETQENQYSFSPNPKVQEPEEQVIEFHPWTAEDQSPGRQGQAEHIPSFTSFVLLSSSTD